MNRVISLTEKQAEYVREGHHRWNFAIGAVRSGKSFIALQYIIPSRVLSGRGKRGINLILGATFLNIERNVLDPMRDIWGAENIGKFSSKGTVQIFGEEVYCVGAEKANTVTKLRGSEVKFCYVDEVCDIHQDSFDILKSRLSLPYSECHGAANPASPQHFLKQFIDSASDDIDVWSQHYSLEDNPFLPEGYVKAIKAEYLGTMYYDRYILGDWCQAEGLVYPMFSVEKNVVDEHGSDGEWYVSMDYGTLNPTAMGLWRIHNGVATMEYEYYYDGRSTRRQKTDEEYYEDLEAFIGDIPVRKIIIDPSAASFQTSIKKHGKFTCMSGVNTVLDGIRYTGSLIMQEKILIHRSCTNTIQEFGLYRWDEGRKDDAPIKDNDHSMDQMRYMCMTLQRKFWNKTYNPIYM